MYRLGTKLVLFKDESVVTQRVEGGIPELKKSEGLLEFVGEKPEDIFRKLNMNLAVCFVQLENPDSISNGKTSEFLIDITKVIQKHFPHT